MIGAIQATARAGAFAVAATLSFAAWAAFEEPVEVKALVESAIAEVNAGYDEPVIRVGGPIAVSETTDEAGYDFVVNLPAVALLAPDSPGLLDLGDVAIHFGDLDTDRPRFKFAIPETMTFWFDEPVSIGVEAGRVEGVWHGSVGLFHTLTVDAKAIVIGGQPSDKLELTTGPLHVSAGQAEPSGDVIVSRGKGALQDLRLMATTNGLAIEIDTIAVSGDQQSPATFVTSGDFADAQARLRSNAAIDEKARALGDLIGGGYYDKIDWTASFNGARWLVNRRPAVSFDEMVLSGGTADLSKPRGAFWFNFDVQGFDDKIGIARAPGEVVPSQLALAVRLHDLALPALLRSLQPQLSENVALGDQTAEERIRETLGLHLATAGTRVSVEQANAANDHYAVQSNAAVRWTDADPANAIVDARIVTNGLRGLIRTLGNYQENPAATQIMGMLGLITAFGNPDEDPAADKLTYDIEVRPGQPARVNGRAIGAQPKRQP